ncbi:MAG: PilZ domain-containing protein [Candidatus Aminicenantes bacterium]|jgi:hypothetical protein|nr:PilZ domain-containing protein [Candidatus Aminicenantes bacterium]MDH5383539.1 PilZ domain-containing protein [Candidatus Aminicenantes bacterium]MDH5743012.1 PilZ domain-containing protein [Candidatus Aminicenantes bacterium]
MERESHNNLNKAEMRKYPRRSFVTGVSYRVVVDYKTMIPSKDDGLTQNISDGGLCLILNRELPPGAILELTFDLPKEDSEPITTRVKVIWQKKIEKGFLTGVKFRSE